MNFAAETPSIVHHETGEFITTDVFGTFVLREAARRAQSLRSSCISNDEGKGATAKGRASRPTSSGRVIHTRPAKRSRSPRLRYGLLGVPVSSRARDQLWAPSFPEKVIPLSARTRG